MTKTWRQNQLKRWCFKRKKLDQVMKEPNAISCTKNSSPLNVKTKDYLHWKLLKSWKEPIWRKHYLIPILLFSLKLFVLSRIVRKSTEFCNKMRLRNFYRRQRDLQIVFKLSEKVRLIRFEIKQPKILKNFVWYEYIGKRKINYWNISKSEDAKTA